VFSAGGLPLIYLGDELGMENDPNWDKDPAHAGDSRWVHRPVFQEALFEERHDPSTVTGRIFAYFKRMIQIRSTYSVFEVQDAQVLESGHPSVLIFQKSSKEGALAVLGNFGELSARPTAEAWRSVFGDTAAPKAVDLLSDRPFSPDKPPELLPCELLWLYMTSSGPS